MDIADFSLDLFSLAGRNALITGGNTGLGRAFSVALAKAGADVFAVGLTEDDGTTRRLIEDTGCRMEFVMADITQPGVPAAVVHRCVETLGSVDILVNSAGIALLSEVEEFGRDLWGPMVSVNLTAAFEIAHEASTFMIRQRSGKIINIASLFSFLGGRRSPAYAATKAGMVGFTKAYCDELAAHNVQVNALAPGYFKTAITEATRADPEADRRIVEHIPAARWGEIADLMGAIVFAPGHAVWRRGALLGFDGSQGRAHIYRSILEGIALTMTNHTAALERALGCRLSPVLASGGGSRSDLMMQIVADVFDRPARRTTVTDAAGLGAAICAAVGHGIYPDWDQATAAMVAVGDQFTPDPRAVRAYQQINKIYAELTSFTDPLFRSMADALQGLARA